MAVNPEYVIVTFQRYIDKNWMLERRQNFAGYLQKPHVINNCGKVCVFAQVNFPAEPFICVHRKHFRCQFYSVVNIGGQELLPHELSDDFEKKRVDERIMGAKFPKKNLNLLSSIYWSMTNLDK